MQIVKFGGSLITVKKDYDAETDRLPEMIFQKKNVEQVVKELKGIKGPLIIVHGAGSFGHPKAKKYGLDKGYNKSDAKRRGAAEVAQDVRELNNRLLSVLSEHGLYCMPVPPNTTVTNRNGKIKKIELGLFKRYLDQGLIPVTFGDLVLDEVRGISICSGDDIMLELAKEYSAKRAVFTMDRDGVFDSDPVQNSKAKLYQFMSEKTISDWQRRMKEESKRVREVERRGVRDATGGIVGKVEVAKKISKLGVEVLILNGKKKGRLKQALEGKKVRATYF